MIDIVDATGQIIARASTIDQAEAIAAMDPATFVDPTSALASVKANARKAVLAFADAMGSRMTDGYPAAEQASWFAKQAEARAIAAGETDHAAFPVIAAEIAITERPAADLAAVVLAKAALFERAAGMISGLRQATLTAIDAAVSAEEIATVLADAKAKAEAKYTELTAG